MILQCRLSIARDHRSRGSPNSSTLIFGMRSGTRQLRTFFNAESPSVIQLFVWAVRSNDKVKLLFSFAGRGAVGAAVHWEADGRHAPYVVQSCRNVHTKLTTHSQLSSPSAQFRGDRVVLYDLFSAIHLVRVHLDLTSMTNANEITLTVMNAFFFLDCCYFTIADSTGFSALPPLLVYEEAQPFRCSSICVFVGEDHTTGSYPAIHPSDMPNWRQGLYMTWCVPLVRPLQPSSTSSSPLFCYCPRHIPFVYGPSRPSTSRAHVEILMGPDGELASGTFDVVPVRRWEFVSTHLFSGIRSQRSLTSPPRSAAVALALAVISTFVTPSFALLP